MRRRNATPGVLSRFLLMKAPRNIRRRARPRATRLVIIKRYKREADCARLIAPLWRTSARRERRNFTIVRSTTALLRGDEWHTLRIAMFYSARGTL